ncbi:nitrilase-related carbon-nitrogen hydrolase [Brachybacterium sp. J144]|uniref:nitrilase-related carbon-nitrogen hydrolase n=1 Tax=Brachybacterium sp. J144 TaxID=3116487 RepID=UPI002E78ECBF|nr:nitrilase-related carbon-nitrogen hydrolase [Brachybacterium sp. J144]MEE1651853.1 nitrilase-related carbon-nitrogen hydrolase [Brachybacterium sp. J144]
MSSRAHVPTATVILAGGASARHGGVDKTRAEVGGASTLERVLRAAPVGSRIVVGPEQADGARLAERFGARFVREDPAGSGPLAALARGAAETGDEHVVLVLGGDLPLLRAETLDRLVAAAARTGRVHCLDLLIAAWPVARLRAALEEVRGADGTWTDLPLRRLYAALDETELVREEPVGAEGEDIDTPAELDRARAAAGPRIALAQIIVHEDPERTLTGVRSAVGRAAEAGADLVLLPEATLTPFGTDLRAAALARHEEFEDEIRRLAAAHRLVVVAGSFTPTADGRVHNTLIARGDGVDVDYRKIHLYDAFGARESETVAPGDQLVTLELRGTLLGFATCYDVRFPEQFTALARRGAQAILLPLAWAEGLGKVEQLRLLLRARALDSTSLLLAADQAPDPAYTGRAARGVGHSAVISPLGEVRQELGREEGMLVTDLDLTEVAAARAALPVLEHSGSLPG